MQKIIIITLLAIGSFASCKKDKSDSRSPDAFYLSGLKDITVESDAVTLALSVTSTWDSAENVTLSATGIPSGITLQIEPPGGIPPFVFSLRFTPSDSLMPGNYLLKLMLKTASGKQQEYDMNITVPESAVFRELSGDISTNVTLSPARKYILKGVVYVTNRATLTIPAGTVVMGDKSTIGTLVITRGARIDARGTATNPVVFTSSLPSGERNAGDWGGVVLLGKAPVNPQAGELEIEGGLKVPEGGNAKEYTWYGGVDANDNSGIMKYVRIEFAGVAYSLNNEINALTMGGVGAGTTISHIQCYRSGDDAFEWFGGTVNADHLVATYTMDDDFDTDLGYSGRVQFGLAQRVKTIADNSGSNGFESDNDFNGSTNTPKTRAVFSNITVVGPITEGNTTSGIHPHFLHGVYLRRHTSQSIYNSIFTGFPIGLYIDDRQGNATAINVLMDSLKFKNNIFAGCPVPFKSTSLGSNWFGKTNTLELVYAEDAMMIDPNRYSPAVSTPTGIPNFLLAVQSPALTGAMNVAGMENVAYRGAFNSSDDWTLGWTTWAAENADY